MKVKNELWISPQSFLFSQYYQHDCYTFKNLRNLCQALCIVCAVIIDNILTLICNDTEFLQFTLFSATLFNAMHWRRFYYIHWYCSGNQGPDQTARSDLGLYCPHRAEEHFFLVSSHQPIFLLHKNRMIRPGNEGSIIYYVTEFKYIKLCTS